MPLSFLPVALVLAQTTTTEVPRIVGEPLPTWVVLLAGLVVGIAIVAAGAYVRSRTRGNRPGSGRV